MWGLQSKCRTKRISGFRGSHAGHVGCVLVFVRLLQTSTAHCRQCGRPGSARLLLCQWGGSNERTAWENRSPLICCSGKGHFCWFTRKYGSENVGCPLTRERKQWTNPNSTFKSVRVHLRESVRLRECVNTELDWEVKTGIVEKSARKRSCPLTRVSVSGEFTIFHSSGLLGQSSGDYCPADGDRPAIILPARLLGFVRLPHGAEGCARLLRTSTAHCRQCGRPGSARLLLCQWGVHILYVWIFSIIHWNRVLRRFWGRTLSH